MEQQETLDLKVGKKVGSVEEYKFDPIKGYPMLHWKGKRPFTSTQYYPAQLKESHGAEVNGWMNKIFWGDNLQTMSHLLKEFRGQVDLVYLDPPYDSKADYKKIIEVKGKRHSNDYTAFEEKQYTDIWSNDEYLQYLYERIAIIRELLSDNGSIYIHLNHDKVHLVRCILDELFGSDNFKNDIIWHNAPPKAHSRYFGRVKDTILFYTKSNNYTWNKQYVPLSESYIASFNKEDSKGKYVTQPLHSGKPAKEVPLWRGIKPPEGRGWAYKIETLDKFEEEGKIEWSSDGTPRLKRYLHEIEGAVVQDVWDDISPVLARGSSHLYPTQKPEELLERIIGASSNPGDLVFDCFMGSGTTQAAAMKLGRRFIGADINLGAVQITTKRLLNIAKELNPSQSKLDFESLSMAANPIAMYSSEKQIFSQPLYTGFEVYNVNHYDVFRNPVEAKDLLVKALEIQPLPNNSLYDGEKDGRMVKIMPVNRIATRADLNELITGFDYKLFEKRNDQNPGKAVESLLLVCMGHEPDLAAFLRSEVPYKLDVEVVDILRDKSNLEFKRDSEAEITVESGKLLIREFYPMNLLQKLSLMKENVEDWRELVESVMIDFNYDGAVFEPTVVDVPGKNELVSGRYPVPASAGMIRVKITDLLSESLEVTINHG